MLAELYERISVSVPTFNLRFDLARGTFEKREFDFDDQRHVGMAARQEVIAAELEK